jgi:hypothetical protein
MMRPCPGLPTSIVLTRRTRLPRAPHCPPRCHFRAPGSPLRSRQASAFLPVRLGSRQRAVGTPMANSAAIQGSAAAAMAGNTRRQPRNTLLPTSPTSPVADAGTRRYSSHTLRRSRSVPDLLPCSVVFEPCIRAVHPWPPSPSGPLQCVSAMNSGSPVVRSNQKLKPSLAAIQVRNLAGRWADFAPLSLHFPSARRWDARDGSERKGTPNDSPGFRRAVYARHDL